MYGYQFVNVPTSSPFYTERPQDSSLSVALCVYSPVCLTLRHNKHMPQDLPGLLEVVNNGGYEGLGKCCYHGVTKYDTSLVPLRKGLCN